MRFRQRTTKWCHVTVKTYRRRKMFKIAATVRFCERVIRDACAAHEWQLDTLLVRADRIQALVAIPHRVQGRTVARRLKAAAAAVIRTRPVCDVGRRVFETGNWCAVVTDGAKVAALRRHLRRRGGRGLSRPTASAPP